ncbi:MAG TPA: hypothetical protein VLA34_05450 [Candidatus Krumholzibacterium sp.]|nr:hypothetical protein [Candidatus Krumholzibacterium sp.]
MKYLLAAFALTLTLNAASTAQNPSIPPFYQVHGGLFYPSVGDFRTTYGAPSDFVWGMGMGLPVSADFLYLIGDLSWFRAKALTPGTPDVRSELSYNFFHLGLLNKYYIAPTLSVRFQGGLNYNSVERKTVPEGGEEVTAALPRKIGYYGGIGLENLLMGGRISVFADFLYDYRRSIEKEIYGDFGGYRLMMGLTTYWF